ncbi:unnamed protein product, partial [Meganyctiphanes norvegica]
VFLSHNMPLNIPSELPTNMKQVRGVTEATKNGFMFGDANVTEADAIVLCTGYDYVFPFLEASCGVYVEDNQVKPLYKHLIHTTFPSMAFIGIPFQICPFPMFHYQVMFFVKSFIDDIKLPSKQEMDAETQQEYDNHIKKGLAPRHFHKMGHLQWGYNDNLAQLMGISPLPPSISNLYDHVHDIRRKTLMTYKESSYRLSSRSSFERVL